MKKPIKKVVKKATTKTTTKQVATTKKVDFEKLTKKEKAVAIARDVIAQLQTKQLVAYSGSYIRLNKRFEQTKSIKANYSKVKRCRVCAIGACLMATTNRVNKLRFIDIGASIDDIDNSETAKIMVSVFTPKQLLLIENSFEAVSDSADRYATGVLDCDRLSESEELKCDKFFGRHEYSANERMIAIMENIIKNKGTFKP